MSVREKPQAVISDQLYRQVTELLFHEAELLDEERLREWLGFLADDVEYLMPVRVTRERGAGSGFLDNMFHFEEDKYRLTKRVERLETGYAWSDNPPSRTRHLVSNIRIEPGDNEDELKVKSYLILYRTRGDDYHHDMLSAERRDVLRRVNGNWKLARRLILLDQATIATHNLSIFL